MSDAAVNPTESWVTLAHLLRPQGRRGEILADLLTDFPEHFSDRQGLFLRRSDGTATPALIEAHWLPVGRNVGRVVLKLEGSDSIDTAELLSGSDLVVASTDRIPLDEAGDEQYISDLLGCTLIDGESTVGVIQDVQFPANSMGARLTEAAPLLVVLSPAGEELLIPFARSWIENIDIAQKRIAMRLPEGLLEING